MPSTSSATSSTSSISEASNTNNNAEQKEKLIGLLKKEVKHIMEESVMLKSIHEDSSTVTSLCAIIDTCLSLGLKRRALGLFKTSSTMALMQKIAKENKDAEFVMKKVTEVEQSTGRRTSSTGDSGGSRLSRTGTLEKVNSGSNLAIITRFLWIRVALFEKKLQKIVCFLVQEADKYYTRDSLVHDQDYGPILSSLLVGPCAIEYTKINKSGFQAWNELPANELVQRHKLSSGSVGSSCGSLASSPSITSNVFATLTPASAVGGGTTPASEGSVSPVPPAVPPSSPSVSRMASTTTAAAASSPHHHHVLLPSRRSLSHTASNFTMEESRSIPTLAREYVESLHQNQWDSLLFGKNNVFVLPKESEHPQAGYLSLHRGTQTEGMALKWTPNRLMNGCTIEDKSASWQQAISVEMNSILFMHCHRDKDDSGTLILIANDGIQHPPIQFPPGGHMMQFLGCLEASLLPEGGKLEPPLGANNKPDFQQDVEEDEKETKTTTTTSSSAERRDSLTVIAGKAKKMFPLLRKKNEEPQAADENGEEKKDNNKASTPVSDDDNSSTSSSTAKATDHVFKIIMPRPPPKAPQSAGTIGLTTNSSEFKAAKMLNPFAQSFAKPPSSAPPEVSKSREKLGAKLSSGSKGSEWFASFFSPSKSRNNSSSSTDRSISAGDNSAKTDIEKLEEEDGDEILKAEINLDEKEEEEEDDTKLPPAAKKKEPISTLCDTMKRQIISRAFYGWLGHCRHMRVVRRHLTGLAFPKPVTMSEEHWREGITAVWWKKRREAFLGEDDPEERKRKAEEVAKEAYNRIYFGGIDPTIRKYIWPYILDHYKWHYSKAELTELDAKTQSRYEHKLSDWLVIEAIVRQRDRETTAASIAKLSSTQNVSLTQSINLSNEVFESADDPNEGNDDDDDDLSSRTVSADKISTITEVTENSVTSTSDRSPRARGKLLSTQSEPPNTSSDSKMATSEEDDPRNGGDSHHYDTDGEQQKEAAMKRRKKKMMSKNRSGLRYQVIGPSVDIMKKDRTIDDPEMDDIDSVASNRLSACKSPSPSSAGNSPCPSPDDASEGGVFPQELVDNFALNLHRIDKDVQRCDRNLAYFTPQNLEKLRNVITTYVFENLDVGYMQGMCDLVAPLLVTFDDEALTHACFSRLMERMLGNFPTGNQMDEHFGNMRSLIQVLDQTLYENIQKNGDFSHFYFCYRWFLLDFKREFTYHEIYLVWETIWSSRKVCSSHFYLFVALALVEKYRDIILDRNMDFTDIIKFFNEMAEKHSAREILQIARDLVFQLQIMIEDDED